MDEPVTTCLYVFVRGSAESTGVTRASAMGCAAFEASNSCVTAKMTRIETGLASGSICDAVRDLVSADEELRDGGGIVFAVKIDLEVTNRDGRGLIRIGLDKGLRDGIGNETDSDWSVIVNKA